MLDYLKKCLHHFYRRSNILQVQLLNYINLILAPSFYHIYMFSNFSFLFFQLFLKLYFSFKYLYFIFNIFIRCFFFSAKFLILAIFIKEIIFHLLYSLFLIHAYFLLFVFEKVFLKRLINETLFLCYLVYLIVEVIILIFK